MDEKKTISLRTGQEFNIMVPTVTSTSVTESPSKTPKIPLSQEILREIRNFVGGATFGSKFSRTELAKSAIFLLKTLPAAREAILEYLCTIFDEAVSLYTHNLELEAGNVSAGSNSTGPLTTSETEDIIIQVKFGNEHRRGSIK